MCLQNMQMSFIAGLLNHSLHFVLSTSKKRNTDNITIRRREDYTCTRP